jgi:replicative DNA helicase
LTSPVEHQLLKLLINHEFFVANKHKLVKDMFPDELGTVYEVLCKAHETYNRSVTLKEVSALHKVMFPTVTTAARNNILALIELVEEVEDIGPDVAKDVVSSMWQQEIGRQIAQLGLKLSEDKISTLQPISDIIERAQDDFVPDDNIVYDPFDMDEMFEELDSIPSWKFNIPSLSARIPGVSPGEFGYVLARTEVGKTAFHVSLSCAPDGFCYQGASVHVICNEERSIRTRRRAFSACTGLTKDQVRSLDGENRINAKSKWSEICKNYFTFDATDMTIEGVDAYCRKHHPDIVIIDQIDKLRVSGNFAREDQRLGEIYTQARNIAKRHDTFVLGLTQASADAEGKTTVTYAMTAENKTSKAAEADLIIGIGKLNPEEGSTGEDDPTRFLYLSKNKITGWHGKIAVVLNNQISRFSA